MARMDHYLIAQGIELGADALEEQFLIAAGQVRAADAVLEEHVATDDKALLGVVEGHMARGMARHEEHVQCFVPEADHLAFLQEGDRGGWGLAIHPEQGRGDGRVLQQGQVLAVHLGP